METLLAGVVEAAGAAAYGAFAEDGRGLRLRLSADDWERLGADLAARVTARLPGRHPADYFVGRTAFARPCWVWADLTPAPVARPRAAVRTHVREGG